MLPDLHTDFSRGRSGGLLVFPFLQNFPQFLVIHTVKGIGIVNKAEVDVFLELVCFFDDQRMLVIENSYWKYHTIALILHASKVMFKILQVRLQQYVNREIPDVQAGFRKGRGTRDQIANIVGSLKKQESSGKASTSALLTMPMPLTVWVTTRPPYLPPEKSVYRSRSNS